MDTPKTILIVDDDPRILRLVTRILDAAGFEAAGISNPDDIWDRLEQAPPDLILLDQVFPGSLESGFTLAAKIRAQRDLPIIMVSGRGDAIDKVVGLESGADDYLSKPFDDRELVARIRALLRRHQQSPPAITPGLAEAPRGQSDAAAFGDWQIDFSGYRLTAPSGQPVHLTSHEFALLAELIQHAGRTLSRDALMTAIAGKECLPEERSIDMLVAKLRKKLAAASPEDPPHPWIITLRGTGYRFSGTPKFFRTNT